jgi:hypothetical protein
MQIGSHVQNGLFGIKPLPRLGSSDDPLMFKSNSKEEKRATVVLKVR